MIRNFRLTRADITYLAQGFGLGAFSVTTYVLAYLGVRAHFDLDWMPVFSTQFIVFAIIVAAGTISLTEWAGARSCDRDDEDATTTPAEGTDS